MDLELVHYAHLNCLPGKLCSLQIELEGPVYGPSGDCLHATMCHEWHHSCRVKIIALSDQLLSKCKQYLH